MESQPTCPSCGKVLPPNAPHGLCPACLVKAGMPTVALNVPESFKLPDASELAQLFPQLEILELLGHGGMGAVYKARQPGLDRIVALKILAPRVQSDPGFAERFNREAKALARLCHPHIVAIYDFGLAGNMLYFIMEFVEGGNLRELQQAGRFSPLEALKIIPQICEALQYAHDQGVVHRDIKPENVMLDKKGRVKIADFGLAKITGLEPAAFRLTGAKDVMGTPHYMAPEQVEHPQEVDHRADIYSLGVVFYEMLTGELPLGRFAPPSRKVEVDVRLDEVVLHTLEKEPTRRYQHASQVGEDVEAIAGSPEEGHRKAPLPLNSGTPAAVLGRAVTICRWIARVFSALLLLFYSYFILGEGLPAIGGEPVGVRLNFVALGLMMAGFAFGFKREGTAALLICTGWALWQGVESHFSFNFLQSPVGVGLLYAFCWWATRRKATAHVVAWAAGLMLFLVVVRLFIPANVFIRGVVNDRATARPIRDAEITTGEPTPGRITPNARSGKEGRYNLYVGWHSAGTPLKISARGYETLTTTLGSRKPGQKLVERNFALSPLQEPPLDAPPISDLMRLPPVVISTSPQAGSKDVDPDTGIIRVTFNLPMLDGNWSWVKTDEKTFPELTGKPSYSSDGRTCLLPVRLKPSSTYVLWLNVDEYSRFRGTNGQPAVPYLLVFKTR